MPSKKSSNHQSGPVEPVDPQKAFTELTRLLEIANQLTAAKNSPEFGAWESNVRIALSRFYGKGSEEYARFGSIWFTPGSYYNGQPESDFTNAFDRGIREARLFLASRVSDWESKTSQTKVAQRTDIENREDVFVVHGHDHGMKETVARFLTKAGLNPIILHEQANEGKTIIEKFEKHADVSFAVALFSNDDLGIARKDLLETKPIEEQVQPRARQNVVLEFGYFMGRLSRRNVVAIVAEGVETPSDYDGVIFVPFDASDGWRLTLIKELKAAGFSVDANALF